MKDEKGIIYLDILAYKQTVVNKFIYGEIPAHLNYFCSVWESLGGLLS